MIGLTPWEEESSAANPSSRSARRATSTGRYPSAATNLASGTPIPADAPFTMARVRSESESVGRATGILEGGVGQPPGRASSASEAMYPKAAH